MNKQELIDKWESKTGAPSYEISDFSINPSKNDMYIAGYGVARTEIIKDLKQLDEPQKPIVPKFVAEWFEDNKDNLEFAIWELCVDSYNAEAEPGIIDWIQCPENKPIETFIRMKDGYEFEKEPMYRVKLGEGYFVEYPGRGALIIPDGNKEIKMFDSKSDAERTAQTIGGTVEEVVEG